MIEDSLRFGLDNGEQHRLTAEAIVNTTVRPIKRCSLEIAAEGDGMVSRKPLNMTTINLQHAENYMLLLGRKTCGIDRRTKFDHLVRQFGRNSR